MDKLLIDHLPIIEAIESASNLTWDHIEANKVEPWITLYREEIADLNKLTAIEMIQSTH